MIASLWDDGGGGGSEMKKNNNKMRPANKREVEEMWSKIKQKQLKNSFFYQKLQK